MRSEFESRETFECIFGGEDGIDLSKDETGEYSFQPSRFAYSFFLVAWQYRQTDVDELQKKNAWLSDVAERENKRANKLQEEKVSTTTLLGKTIQEKNELQKRVDAQTKHIETALLAVKDIHKSARDEFMDWDVLAEKAPKLCQHMQDLSVAVGELEQALKGES